MYVKKQTTTTTTTNPFIFSVNMCGFMSGSQRTTLEAVLSSTTQIMGIELMSPGFRSMLLHPLSHLSPVTLISAGSTAEDSCTP